VDSWLPVTPETAIEFFLGNRFAPKYVSPHWARHGSIYNPPILHHLNIMMKAWETHENDTSTAALPLSRIAMARLV